MKILAIQLGRIGDMILLTPAFEAIKNKYPNSELHVISSRSNYFIPQGDKRVDKVFVYKKTPLEIIKLYRALKKENYDFYIDHKDHFSTESSYFARIINAKTKVGFNRKNEKTFFDIGIKSQEENDGVHFVDRVLFAYSFAGINPKECNRRPSLYLEQNSAEYLADWLDNNNISNYIVFNISTHIDIRNWKIEYWKKLAEKAEELNLNIIISSGPEDKEKAQFIASNLNKTKAFPSRSIKDAIALCERADLIISPDTSFIHIAAAFNKPTIALYGTDPFPLSKFCPLSDNYILITPQNGDFVRDIEYEVVEQALIKMKALGQTFS